MSTTPEYTILSEADQVTPEILAIAEYIYDGWFSQDERIDWEDFVERLCRDSDFVKLNLDIENYDDPAVRKIKRHIRKIRDAG